MSRAQGAQRCRDAARLQRAGLPPSRSLGICSPSSCPCGPEAEQRRAAAVLAPRPQGGSQVVREQTSTRAVSGSVADHGHCCEENRDEMESLRGCLQSPPRQQVALRNVRWHPCHVIPETALGSRNTKRKARVTTGKTQHVQETTKRRQP